MNRPIKTSLTTVVSLLLASVSAVTYANGATELETLTVTGSRSQQSIGKLGANLSVISSEELKQITHVHISESLSRIPGVWASRGNGQESLPAIRSPSLTGAGSCGAFYIAEDGIPVRPTGFCNVNQLFDSNSEQAQRIDVIKGPGNAIHGSGAMHGVINVLSRGPSAELENSLSLEGGPHDYNRIKFSHSNTLGRQGYRVSINSTSDGGYKDDSGFDQQKMSLRHDVITQSDLSIKTSLYLGNLNQETAGYVEGLDAYKDDDRKRENPNPEAYRDSQSARLQSRIERSLDNGGKLIVTPYVRYSDMEFLMHFLPGTPVEENGQHSIGLQSAYVRPISDQLTLTNGFDIEYTDAYLKQSQDGGFSSFPSGKQYDYEVSAKVIAAFLDGSYTVNSDTIISAGTRFEAIKYDYDNHMIAGDTADDGRICVNGFTGATGCRYSRPEDRKDDFNNWSLSADIVHQLSARSTLVARFSHGFRAPQATELYRLQAGQVSADLDPEEINALELTLRGTVQNFSYSVSGFYMDKANVIFQDNDRLNTDSGETRHYGIEYEIYRSFGAEGTVDLTLSGTFARHKYSKDVTAPAPGSQAIIATKDNDVDTAPRRMGSAQLGWQLSSATRAELEWVSMGKYYTDIGNQHSYSGHELFNLRLRHQFSDKFSGGLRIVNLADKDYAERADYSSFAGDRYFIGEPRSLFADVQLTF